MAGAFLLFESELFCDHSGWSSTSVTLSCTTPFHSFYSTHYYLTWILVYLFICFVHENVNSMMAGTLLSTHHYILGPRKCLPQSECPVGTCWMTEEVPSTSAVLTTLLLSHSDCPPFLFIYHPEAASNLPPFLSINSKSTCRSNQSLIYFSFNKMEPRKLVSNLPLIVGCLFSVCVSFSQLGNKFLDVRIASCIPHNAQHKR